MLQINVTGGGALAYDVPLNISIPSRRQKVYVDFQQTAKSDRKLISETKRSLKKLSEGLKVSLLESAVQEKILELVYESVRGTQHRLTQATEAADTLMLEADCPIGVHKQLQALRQSWGKFYPVLQQIRRSLESGDAGNRLSIGSCSLTSTEILRTELTDGNAETSAEYNKMYDRILNYTKSTHNTVLTICSIERIENPVLEKQLKDARRRLHMRNCQTEQLLHGTLRANAESIIRDGFRLGRKGMFGPGVYFATDSTKSAQYCKDAGVKSMLVCEVLLGKTLVCRTSRNDMNLATLRAEGYDSVYAQRNSRTTRGVLYDEFVVYDPTQATPRYLVKFTTS